MITSIAINFQDNDFQKVFVDGVMPFLKTMFYMNGSLPEDKEQLCFIINKLSPICYVALQNTWSYGELECYRTSSNRTDESEEYKSIEKYLHREPNHIYLNKEVDEFIKSNNGWCNCEVAGMTLNVYPEPYIYCI